MATIFAGGSPEMGGMLSRLLERVDGKVRAPNQPHTMFDGLPTPGGRLLCQVSNLQTEMRSWGLDVPADYGRSAAADVYAKHIAELYHVGGKRAVEDWMASQAPNSEK